MVSRSITSTVAGSSRLLSPSRLAAGGVGCSAAALALMDTASSRAVSAYAKETPSRANVSIETIDAGRRASDIRLSVAGQEEDSNAGIVGVWASRYLRHNVAGARVCAGCDAEHQRSVCARLFYFL